MTKIGNIFIRTVFFISILCGGLVLIIEVFSNGKEMDATPPTPMGISYGGHIAEYSIRPSGSRDEINIIEFINNAGQHCMIGISGRGQFSMICENH